jgi:hypothetical protein
LGLLSIYDADDSSAPALASLDGANEDLACLRMV